MTVSTFADGLKELTLSVLVIPDIVSPPDHVDLVALIWLAFENGLEPFAWIEQQADLQTINNLPQASGQSRWWPIVFRGEDDA